MLEWDQAADSEDSLENAAPSEWQLNQAVGRAVSVTKKRYAELTRDHTSDVQSERRRTEATTEKCAKREA